MFCLISPIEIIYNPYVNNEQVGYRVADISATQFEVANPLFWIECPEYITKENNNDFYYNDQGFFNINDIQDPYLIPVTEISNPILPVSGV